MRLLCHPDASAASSARATIDDILAEVDALDAREVVLVAQDLASFGRDQGQGERRIVPLVEAVAARSTASGSCTSTPPTSPTS